MCTVHTCCSVKRVQTGVWMFTITGWEGTRWQSNEGWTNLLNDTTWNAAFKIPSGLASLRTCSVKHDTYLRTCWWSTQACPIGWWHVPSASWPPHPAALLWSCSLAFFTSRPPPFLNFRLMLVFVRLVNTACAPLGWDYLSFLVIAFGVSDWDWGLGCPLFTGPLAVKSSWCWSGCGVFAQGYSQGEAFNIKDPPDGLVSC